MPEPQRVKVLAETREEGGIIIVDPSRGSVHPSGKPYVRIRGGVTTIRTITPQDRALLYDSIRAFDEMPPQAHQEPSLAQMHCSTFRLTGGTGSGERPGDLFDHDPGVTWESLLLPLGWQLVRTDEKGEGYWRHPGKRGPTHSATTNADGTNRLFCFSASPGLPVERYLTKFEFYAWWYHSGDFSAAAKALAERGYTTRQETTESQIDGVLQTQRFINMLCSHLQLSRYCTALSMHMRGILWQFKGMVVGMVAHSSHALIYQR